MLEQINDVQALEHIQNPDINVDWEWSYDEEMFEDVQHFKDVQDSIKIQFGADIEVTQDLIDLNFEEDAKNIEADGLINSGEEIDEEISVTNKKLGIDIGYEIFFNKNDGCRKKNFMKGEVLMGELWWRGSIKLIHYCKAVRDSRKRRKSLVIRTC